MNNMERKIRQFVDPATINTKWWENHEVLDGLVNQIHKALEEASEDKLASSWELDMWLWDVPDAIRNHGQYEEDWLPHVLGKIRDIVKEAAA